MLIKFTAKTMRQYAGIDGLGGSVKLSQDDVVEVSDSVAKLLMRTYGGNFEAAMQEKPAHAPKADKFLRKRIKTKIK